MITRSMSKKLDKKYNMRVRPNNDNAIQRERRDHFKRIPVEIYSGFLMQLVGDQLVNSDGSQSNLLRMLNEKYNKEINATCSDRQTYYDLRAERINNPFKDQIVSHSFDGDTLVWVTPRAVTFECDGGKLHMDGSFSHLWRLSSNCQ